MNFWGCLRAWGSQGGAGFAERPRRHLWRSQTPPGTQQGLGNVIAGPGEAAASEGRWAGPAPGQGEAGANQIVIPFSEGTAGHGSNRESGTLPLTMSRDLVAQERGSHCPEVAPAFSGSISVPCAKILRDLWALSSLDPSWAPSGAADTGHV